MRELPTCGIALLATELVTDAILMVQAYIPSNDCRTVQGGPVGSCSMSTSTASLSLRIITCREDIRACVQHF